MSEKIDPNECIWKPPLIKKTESGTKIMKFPCRYPDKPKTTETCVPCLLGDVFVMSYTQTSMVKNQQGMSEEIMTYLKNFTSDGDIQDFK